MEPGRRPLAHVRRLETSHVSHRQPEHLPCLPDRHPSLDHCREHHRSLLLFAVQRDLLPHKVTESQNSYGVTKSQTIDTHAASLLTPLATCVRNGTTLGISSAM